MYQPFALLAFRSSDLSNKPLDDFSDARLLLPAFRQNRQYGGVVMSDPPPYALLQLSTPAPCSPTVKPPSASASICCTVWQAVLQPWRQGRVTKLGHANGSRSIAQGILPRLPGRGVLQRMMPMLGRVLGMA